MKMFKDINLNFKHDLKVKLLPDKDKYYDVNYLLKVLDGILTPDKKVRIREKEILEFLVSQGCTDAGRKFVTADTTEAVDYIKSLHSYLLDAYRRNQSITLPKPAHLHNYSVEVKLNPVIIQAQNEVDARSVAHAIFTSATARAEHKMFVKDYEIKEIIE